MSANQLDEDMACAESDAGQLSRSESPSAHMEGSGSHEGPVSEPRDDIEMTPLTLGDTKNGDDSGVTKRQLRTRSSDQATSPCYKSTYHPMDDYVIGGRLRKVPVKGKGSKRVAHDQLSPEVENDIEARGQDDGGVATDDEEPKPKRLKAKSNESSKSELKQSSKERSKHQRSKITGSSTNRKAVGVKSRAMRVSTSQDIQHISDAYAKAWHTLASGESAEEKYQRYAENYESAWQQFSRAMSMSDVNEQAPADTPIDNSHGTLGFSPMYEDDLDVAENVNTLPDDPMISGGLQTQQLENMEDAFNEARLSSSGEKVLSISTNDGTLEPTDMPHSSLTARDISAIGSRLVKQEDDSKRVIKAESPDVEHSVEDCTLLAVSSTSAPVHGQASVKIKEESE